MIETAIPKSEFELRIRGCAASPGRFFENMVFFDVTGVGKINALMIVHKDINLFTLPLQKPVSVVAGEIYALDLSYSLRVLDRMLNDVREAQLLLNKVRLFV